MRCVHGEQGGEPAAGAVEHYTTTNETVTDNFTGAVWQRGVDNVESTHVRTLEYCRDLTLERRGWTLPSVKSLSTLVDVTRDPRRINPGAFLGTPGRFGSGSPHVGKLGLAWDVNFHNGSVSDNPSDPDLLVRCVRWE